MYITFKLVSLTSGHGGQMLATSGYVWEGPGGEVPRGWSIWILVILCGCVGSLCKHLSYFVYKLFYNIPIGHVLTPWPRGSLRGWAGRPAPPCAGTFQLVESWGSEVRDPGHWGVHA